VLQTRHGCCSMTCFRQVNIDELRTRLRKMWGSAESGYNRPSEWFPLEVWFVKEKVDAALKMLEAQGHAVDERYP